MNAGQEGVRRHLGDFSGTLETTSFDAFINLRDAAGITRSCCGSIPGATGSVVDDTYRPVELL